jgi:hypothetical protein
MPFRTGTPSIAPASGCSTPSSPGCRWLSSRTTMDPLHDARGRTARGPGGIGESQAMKREEQQCSVPLRGHCPDQSRPLDRASLAGCQRASRNCSAPRTVSVQSSLRMCPRRDAQPGSGRSLDCGAAATAHTTSADPTSQHQHAAANKPTPEKTLSPASAARKRILICAIREHHGTRPSGKRIPPLTDV